MSDPRALPSVVLVTGTGTGVGKTVATAALASLIRSRGSSVAMVKVAQTGVSADDAGDTDEVARLAGPLPTHEFLRLPDPLAPDAAARRAGVSLPPVAVHARRVGELVGETSIVVVEGSGGLLVRLDDRGGTLADLGVALRYKGMSCGVVLVASAGLGTLNSAALTAEALSHRNLPLLGVIIGDWPAEPGLAEESNVTDLPRVTGAPLWGRIPMGAGRLDAAAFAELVPSWMEMS